MILSDECLRKKIENIPKGFPLWNHSSFQKFLDHCSQLNEIKTYLPPDLSTEIFPGQKKTESLWSSYKDHGYGLFFYALARVLKPDLCVEIGVLHGFSLLTVASALRDNGKGMVHGFDLFEKYPYRHDSYANLSDRIEMLKLKKWTTAKTEDAFDVYKRFGTPVDYLHVDISNNGDTYRKIFEQWNRKVKKIMLFEGGSMARDKVEWMIKYEKTPINSLIDELKNKYPDWNIFVLEPYPSLTIAIRK